MRLAAHNGVPHVFRETKTTDWVTLLNTHHEETFRLFLSQNERRLSTELLHEFWTPASLQSDAAQAGGYNPTGHRCHTESFTLLVPLCRIVVSNDSMLGLQSGKG